MALCGSWISDLDAICPCGEDDFAPGDLARWAGIAEQILYKLSGEQWPGVCSDAIRPCSTARRSVQSLSYAAPLTGSRPVVWFGSCVACTGELVCGCSAHDRVLLPHGPVREITGVTIDGVALTDSDWTLIDRRYLIRSDGTAWPCCQDLGAATTEEGTWEVAYDYGIEPPTAAVEMAGILACELAKGCSSDQSCRLPRRTQQLSREGISMTVIDPFEFFEAGRTGLYEVDAWLAAVNPGGIDRPAKLINPAEYGRARRAR